MKLAVAALLVCACSSGAIPTHAAACTTAEVERFLADCVDGSALVIHCQQFSSTHARCNECLRPKRGLGPVIERAGGVEANPNACRTTHACGDIDASDSIAALRAASLAFCGP